MSLDITARIIAKYTSKRDERQQKETTKDDQLLWAYLQAAAVLHCFACDSLQPLNSTVTHPHPRVLLYDYVVPAAGGLSEGLFTLKPATRQEALRKFTSRTAMQAALQANPDRLITDVQKLWENYLSTGTIPPPEKMGYKQLNCLCQVLTWLGGMDDSLPSQADVLQLLHRKSVLASFEHLVISNFTGRKKELRTLNQHIGNASTSILDWFSSKKKPILAIHGPGGIGKSALVGRLLWENFQGDNKKKIPFAYLAFDQPNLRIETPFTILVEVAAQLALQLPELAAVFIQFNDVVRDYRDGQGAINNRGDISATRTIRLNAYRSADETLYSEFASLLDIISKQNNPKSPLPVLIVLDTFEEVQYRDRESLSAFWRMLGIIQREFSLLSIIIAGRTPIADLGIDKDVLQELPLERLDQADSITLLNALGVTDGTVAKAVAGQVGGNPLSLRLAANLITSDTGAAGTSGIKNLSTSNWMFFRLDEQIIQGQLYKRILDHIHNEEVRKLAHPGMVLRITSPEIILYVLAPVCKIAIESITEAEALFEALKREHALVTMGDAGTLVYRPEIRQSMIRLLKQDKYAEVRTLHNAAIAFYIGQETIEARAEEMYHRLALGENSYHELDQRWIKGIEQSIASNLEEYPDHVKVWLASRMALEVPRDIYANADIMDWERNITRKIKRALKELQFKWALELLGERKDRSEQSPLFALEAKVYMLIENNQRAWEVLEQGVEKVSGSTNRGRLAELFWLQSQVALLRKDPPTADEKLEQAAQAIAGAANPIPLIQILCHRLLIHDTHHLSNNNIIPALRFRLNAACERINESNAYTVPFVIELAIPLLGDEYPKTRKQLESFNIHGFKPTLDILTTENLRGLDEYRESWEQEEDNYLYESLV
ncbi:ATP-binding protein [Chitinophaga sp. GbtcB8]|uniref:ATP-binding protein n=1 Tax=Chitinophaga sp. GbtcB8 TaxID=2824753 RepID=UPI001C3037DA|nr:ATP-binding protein [Chitinophaga sp. GbtcB8]